MHNICTEATLYRFAGTSTERDFVEAPSQMLENWCYEKESLKKMSSHYETKASLPDDIIEKMILGQSVTFLSMTYFYLNFKCIFIFV